LITASFGIDNGVDRLFGGIGDDIYFLGKADRAIEDPNEGFDTIVTDYSYKLGANIESLDFRAHLGSTIGLVGTGNELANYFRSNLGADRLIGKGGSDRYEVYNSAIKVIEKDGEGNEDTVWAHVDFRLPNNVENLILQDETEGFTPFNGYGNKSNNLIFGNVENNFLDGRAGDDVIDGGKGNDQLTGGPGFDDFVFSSELDAGDNVDGIHDFRSADDQIVLSRELFGGLPEGILTSANFESILGSTATLAVPEIIFDQNTGKLYYDADGTGTTEPVAFAVLDPTPVGYVGMVSASDFEVVSLA
jgi:Ca2+-binding RTX toxin-like protein